MFFRSRLSGPETCGRVTCVLVPGEAGVGTRVRGRHQGKGAVGLAALPSPVLPWPQGSGRPGLRLASAPAGQPSTPPQTTGGGRSPPRRRPAAAGTPWSSDPVPSPRVSFPLPDPPAQCGKGKQIPAGHSGQPGACGHHTTSRPCAAFLPRAPGSSLALPLWALGPCVPLWLALQACGERLRPCSPAVLLRGEEALSGQVPVLPAPAAPLRGA